jgi:DMSO/TMAO reductase YedYZ molybdopterin-dependent catalytic subunit
MSEHNTLITRRRLVTGLAATGAVTTAAGWAAVRPKDAKYLLQHVSRWNDLAQAALFSPDRLAQTYSPDAITRPFPFNGFYPESLAPEVDGTNWRLRVEGRVRETADWTLDHLRSLPQEDQITRLICIEGWSAVGKWGGVPLRHFLQAIGADLNARYVAFRCADDYYTSIDMASALHPQTILALTFLDRALPTQFGFPLRLRIPTKLGFKNAKHIVAIEVTNEFRGGYWEDQGYNWFSGI